MRERIQPFVVYIVFLVIEEGLDMVGGVVFVTTYRQALHLGLYPVKIALVAGLLIYFWPRYGELHEKPWRSPRELAWAVGTGLVVYSIWVHMDWPWAVQGTAEGYNPFEAGQTGGVLLAGGRLFGAAVVVPIMEELFWRSFLLRYLVTPRFDAIPLGTFTLPSFLACSVLFGLEHHLWLAGIVAGLAYAVILYGTCRL